MAIIKSENKSFTGERVNVPFVNGQAETTDQWAINWFKNNGYEVIEENNKDEKGYSIDEMTKEQIVEELQKAEISFDSKAKKEDLFNLLTGMKEGEQGGED